MYIINYIFILQHTDRAWKNEEPAGFYRQKKERKHGQVGFVSPTLYMHCIDTDPTFRGNVIPISRPSIGKEGTALASISPPFNGGSRITNRVETCTHDSVRQNNLNARPSRLEIRIRHPPTETQQLAIYGPAQGLLESASAKILGTPVSGRGKRSAPGILRCSKKRIGTSLTPIRPLFAIFITHPKSPWSQMSQHLRSTSVSPPSPLYRRYRRVAWIMLRLEALSLPVPSPRERQLPNAVCIAWEHDR